MVDLCCTDLHQASLDRASGRGAIKASCEDKYGVLLVNVADDVGMIQSSGTTSDFHYRGVFAPRLPLASARTSKLFSFRLSRS